MESGKFWAGAFPGFGLMGEDFAAYTQRPFGGEVKIDGHGNNDHGCDVGLIGIEFSGSLREGQDAVEFFFPKGVFGVNDSLNFWSSVDIVACGGGFAQRVIWVSEDVLKGGEEFFGEGGGYVSAQVQPEVVGSFGKQGQEFWEGVEEIVGGEESVKSVGACVERLFV